MVREEKRPGSAPRDAATGPGGEGRGRRENGGTERAVRAGEARASVAERTEERGDREDP